MSDISNPHDRFFREIFSRKEEARNFLLNFLPDDLIKILDMDSLEARKDSFVDGELKEHLSDLLYKAALKGGGDVYVYMLFDSD